MTVKKLQNIEEEEAPRANRRATLRDIDGGIDEPVGQRTSLTRGEGGVRRLSKHQTKSLAHKLNDKLSSGEEHHGHGHGEKAQNFFTAIISGIINFLLMFGLCSAYGLIMFPEAHQSQHTALGVKINLGSSMIVGFLVAFFSKIRVAIGGPDLNPVVLIGNFVAAMQSSIADQLSLDLPSGRRLAGGDESIDESAFCMGAHLLANEDQCADFHTQLRATTIFATAVSSLVFVVLFVIFGRFKFTRYVSYIPTSIMEAFLSCIGYKVFLYALKFCKYDPFQFVPAACIGVPLYFMKAYHIGHPGIVMPLGFLLPLGLFYAGLYGIFGSTVDMARENKLMFPKMENVAFYEVYTDTLLRPESVNIQAWLTTLPDLAIMVILVLLDCLLKINGTEAKLHIKVDKDYEAQLFGMSNILTTLTGSSVGYMQLKFNVINAGVMQNTSDRRGAMVYAALCAACYFGTIEPINFMPRFFVGALLFFAGAGFVCENLWGSRRYLHAGEWLEVLIILVVFILSGQLLIAVITGGVICGVSFIMKYARVPTIEGKPQRGAELKIVQRRGPLMLRMIRHITESWLLVVRLKGYVFFASAQSLTAHVLSIIQSEEEQGLPLYKRLRIVVFDCKMLDGVDASASKAFAGFVRDVREHKVRVLWSGMTKAFHDEFKARGILLSERNVLMDLEEAVMNVEDLAQRYLSGIEQRWIGLHKRFADHQRFTTEHYSFEPFTQIFLSTTGRIGCPWRYCSRIPIEGHQTVLWTPGEHDGMLYLVHSGAVGLFRTLPQDDEHWGSPVAVYRHGWFLNRETIMRMPSKFYGVALEDGELLCWNQQQWWDMTLERPLMMSEILKGVMKQQARDCDTMEIFEHSRPQERDSDDAAWDDVFRASSFQRQATDERSDLSASRRIVGEQFADLPEILTSRLQNLETANFLGKLKFFDPPPDDETPILPGLPSFLEDDLLVAFDTYEEGGKISSTTLSKALMFAGVFDISQTYTPSVEEVLHSKGEFLNIGQKALMAPFCRRDLRTIEMHFKQADVDRDGMLSRHELQSFMKDTLSKEVHMEEVDGIVAAWAQNDATEKRKVKLDLTVITSVMSVFVRRHEHYWNMLKAFMEVLGTDAIRSNDMLKVEHLTRNENIVCTKEDAEEMIWAANWRLGTSGAANELPWTEFVSAIIVCITRSPGSLPPEPTIPKNMRGGGEGLPEATVSSGNLAGGKASSSNLQRGVSAGSNGHHVRGFTREVSAGSDGLNGHHHRSFKRGVSTGSEMFRRGVSTGSEAFPRGISPTLHQTGMTDQERADERAVETMLHDLEPKQPLPDDAWHGIQLRDEIQDGPKDEAPSIAATKGMAAWVAFFLDPSKDSFRGRTFARIGYCLIVLSVLETLLEPFISKYYEERSLWFVLECIVTGIFTFEILLRVYFAKAKIADLFKTFLYWCLVIATLPLYLELLLGLFMKETAFLYKAVNLMRLARLARLSRLASGRPVLEAVVVSLVVVWGIYKMHQISA